MPTDPQSYVQPTAQGNVPFLSNNGNPNIVYNQPGIGGGYIPPMFGNDGIWRVNPVPQRTPFWQQPTGTGQGFPVPLMPAAGPLAPRPSLPPGPGVSPVAPPTADPFVRSGGGGGFDLGGAAYRGGMGDAFGGQSIDPFTGATAFDYYNLDRQGQYNPTGTGRSSGSGGTYFPYRDYTSGAPTGAAGLASTLGMGDMRSWQQILDVVSEPWVPGNLYNSQTGQWGTGDTSDWRQWVDMLTQSVLPVDLYDSYNKQWMWQDDYHRAPNVAGYQDPFGTERRMVLPNYQSPFAQSINNPYAGITDSYFGTGTTPFGAQDQLRTVNYADLSGYSKPANDPWAGAIGAVFGPGAAEGTTGCVVVGSYIGGGDERLASDVVDGDTMVVIDPVSYELGVGKVSYAETKTMPCVRITTKSGVTLDCSTTAPIADEDGNQVLAPALLGVSIPVMDNGMIDYDVVMSVEDIGNQLIRHITVENNFFLAGKQKGRYVLHHNVKAAEGKAAPVAQDDRMEQIKTFDNSLNWAGLKWGW